MADEITSTVTAEVVPQPTAPLGLSESLRQRLDSVHAFGLPDNTMRATFCISLVLAMVWMLWRSANPEAPNGRVPDGLVTAAGVAAGYYLSGDASASMKAALSMIFVFAAIAFWTYWGWLPESLNGQFSNVIGIYFARKVFVAKTETTTATVPQGAQP